MDGWVLESKCQFGGRGCFFVCVAKLDWRVRWNIYHSFPKPRSGEPLGKGEGGVCKATCKDLDSTTSTKITDPPFGKSVLMAGLGSGGAGPCEAHRLLGTENPQDVTGRPCWEQLHFLFFPSSCPPWASPCFRKIHVERFLQKGAAEKHREKPLVLPAPPLCYTKWRLI